MKRLLCIPILFLFGASAFAIEISESMLNSYVAQKLAEKRQRDVHVLDPKITLLDGYATICAKVRAKVLAQDMNCIETLARVDVL